MWFALVTGNFVLMVRMSRPNIAEADRLFGNPWSGGPYIYDIFVLTGPEGKSDHAVTGNDWN